MLLWLTYRFSSASKQPIILQKRTTNYLTLSNDIVYNNSSTLFITAFFLRAWLDKIEIAFTIWPLWRRLEFCSPAVILWCINLRKRKDNVSMGSFIWPASQTPAESSPAHLPGTGTCTHPRGRCLSDRWWTRRPRPSSSWRTPETAVLFSARCRISQSTENCVLIDR